MNRILALALAAVGLTLLWLWRGRLRDVQREKLDHFRFYEILPEVPGDTAVAQRMQLLGQLNTPAVPPLWFRTAKLDYTRTAYPGLLRNNRVPWLGRSEDKADETVWRSPVYSLEQGFGDAASVVRWSKPPSTSPAGAVPGRSRGIR